MKKQLRQLTACLLLILLILSGCSGRDIAASGDIQAQNTKQSELQTDTPAENQSGANTGSPHTQNEFESFTRQFFVDMMRSADALTLHYQLKNPSTYHIEPAAVNLGRIDLTSIDENDTETEDALRKLLCFNYDELSADQQLTYDIMKDYLQTEMSFDNDRLFLYQEVLNSMSGIHSLLPILMSEYTFYDKDDIDVYLTLMADFPAYFENILEFEQAKADAGLFMSDESADEVISACEEFIADPENNMLIVTFPEKLEGMEGLSDADIAAYTDQNTQAVMDAVIPAYENLIAGMNALKGSGNNENGLYYFENGADYYEYLVRTQTGSTKTPDELIDWLDETMQNSLIRLSVVLSADEEVLDRLDDASDIDNGEPEEILQTLQQSLTSQFPAAVTDQYVLKYVPESLESSMNPAFYMIPPVDNPESNVIYLNNGQLTDNLSIFTTLAHEGYPGHLYQHSAFAATNPDPIRQQMSYPGYVEGWATYVENASYGWAGLDKALTQFMKINQELTLCLYARTDLGIHYEGWTEDDVMTFLTDFGLGDAEIAHEVFRAIVTDPTAYLPYCIGWMEFQAIRDTTKETMGDQFDLKDFHQFLLNLGPCPFDIIEKYIEKDLIIS